MSIRKKMIEIKTAFVKKCATLQLPFRTNHSQLSLSMPELTGEEFRDMRLAMMTNITFVFGALVALCMLPCLYTGYRLVKAIFNFAESSSRSECCCRVHCVHKKHCSSHVCSGKLTQPINLEEAIRVQERTAGAENLIETTDSEQESSGREEAESTMKAAVPSVKNNEASVEERHPTLLTLIDMIFVASWMSTVITGDSDDNPSVRTILIDSWVPVVCSRILVYRLTSAILRLERKTRKRLNDPTYNPWYRTSAGIGVAQYHKRLCAMIHEQIKIDQKPLIDRVWEYSGLLPENLQTLLHLGWLLMGAFILPFPVIIMVSIGLGFSDVPTILLDYYIVYRLRCTENTSSAPHSSHTNSTYAEFLRYTTAQAKPETPAKVPVDGAKCIDADETPQPAQDACAEERTDG